MLPTNCANCPFARHLDSDRYVCTNSATSADVVRGHWEPSKDCVEVIAPAIVSDEIAEIKANYQMVLNQIDKLIVDIELEKINSQVSAWLHPANEWLEVETYQANLANQEWLTDWYQDYENWLYEGEDCVGCEDPQPLESKYPHLRANYAQALDEF